MTNKIQLSREAVDRIIRLGLEASVITALESAVHLVSRQLNQFGYPEPDEKLVWKLVLDVWVSTMAKYQEDK